MRSLYCKDKIENKRKTFSVSCCDANVCVAAHKLKEDESDSPSNANNITEWIK